MLVERENLSLGWETSIERWSLAAACRSCGAKFAANRKHCDWSASSGAAKYLPEKCASAQPKPNRSRARSEASSASANEGCTQKQSAASRRYREAYNREHREATTGAPVDCSTWMLNATIFRFGSSSYYFSSPASRHSACVGTSSVDEMKGSSFFFDRLSFDYK